MTDRPDHPPRIGDYVVRRGYEDRDADMLWRVTEETTDGRLWCIGRNLYNISMAREDAVVVRRAGAMDGDPGMNALMTMLGEQEKTT